MKILRIAAITKWRLVLIGILALLPCASMAQDTATLDQQLIEAAKRGDKTQVKTLFDKGADAYAGDEDGLAPVTAAACNGHLEVVELLLKKGVDVNAGDRIGRTA
jgi:ankyrin repeat protein